MTPSETLTRAADLIRDTAAAAHADTWHTHSINAYYREDARWIALMSPAVADAQERILRASSAAWAKAEESYRRDRSVINPSPEADVYDEIASVIGSPVDPSGGSVVELQRALRMRAAAIRGR